MLNKLTDIATKFNEIGITEITFKADWDFRDRLNADLIRYFSNYGNGLPRMHDEELDITIMGIDFLIVSEPRVKVTPKFAGTLSLKDNPMIANTNLGENWDKISQKLAKSYYERETKIWEDQMKGKKDLFNWCEENKNKMSTRLYNVLTNRNYFGQDACIEDLNWGWFNKFRNCGPKRWEEFVKLRGY